MCLVVSLNNYTGLYGRRLVIYKYVMAVLIMIDTKKTKNLTIPWEILIAHKILIVLWVLYHAWEKFAFYHDYNSRNDLLNYWVVPILDSCLFKIRDGWFKNLSCLQLSILLLFEGVSVPMHLIQQNNKNRFITYKLSLEQ